MTRRGTGRRWFGHWITKPTPFRFGVDWVLLDLRQYRKPAAAFKKQSSKIRIVVVGRWDSSRRVLHGEALRHRQSRLLQKYVMLGNATIRNSRPHNWVSLAATDFRENDDVPGKLRYIAASSSKQSPDPMPPILLDCGKIGLTSAISAQSVLET